jgi:hypothetical protein
VSLFDDPTVSNALGQLIADAISKASGVLLRLYRERRTRDTYLANEEFRLADLVSRLSQAPPVVWTPDTVPAEVLALLQSREFATLVEQLLARHLLRTISRESQATLRAALHALIELYRVDRSTFSPDPLFETLTKRCEAIADSVPVQDEVIKKLWQRAVVYDLDAIRHGIENLAHMHRRQLDSAAVKDFEDRLRLHVEKANSHIPSGLSGPYRSAPIEKLYVEPWLEKRQNVPYPRHEDQPEIVLLSKVRSNRQRTAILGQPGVGKSTLSNKLAFDASTSAAWSSDPVTFVVILRDLYSDRGGQGMSFVRYMTHYCRSQYQIAAASPELIEHLLLSGRLDVVFDGLDEITDATDYQHTVHAIEAFCLEYKAAGVIVTSRPYGFEPRRFPDFETYELKPFDSHQVATYVGNWLSVDDGVSHSEALRYTDEFLSQSAGADDLRRVPLLLTLMCYIFRTEGYVPQSRSEVYERCAMLYFRDWDKRRKVRADPRLAELPPDLILKVFSAIAFGIQADREQLNAGITSPDLVELIRIYLYRQEVLSAEDESEVSRSLAEFATGRAWMLHSHGRDRQNRSLYQFTHRTFLEYFTAEYLIKHVGEPDKLARHVIGLILDGKQVVVGELVFQLCARRRPHEFDRAVRYLVAWYRKAGPEHRSQLAPFLVSLLGLTTLTRRLTSMVIDVVIESLARHVQQIRTGAGRTRPTSDAILDWPSPDPGSVASPPAPDWAVHVLTSLLQTTVASPDVLVNAIHNALRELGRGSPDACVAIVAAITSIMVEEGNVVASTVPSLWRQWPEVCHDLLRVRRTDGIDAVLRKDQSLALLCWWSGAVTTREILDWHGIGALYTTPEGYVVPPSFESLAEVLVARISTAAPDSPVPYLDWDGSDPWQTLVEFATTCDDRPTIAVLGSPRPIRIHRHRALSRLSDQVAQHRLISAHHEVGAILLLLLDDRLASDIQRIRMDVLPLGGLSPYRAFLRAGENTSVEVSQLAAFLPAGLPDELPQVLLRWTGLVRRVSAKS